MNDDELLHDLYYNKHNYGGLEQLYKKAKLIHPKIKKAFVSDWLTSQTAKQQTEKITVGKKQFLPIYSEVPYSFQIDLTFFPRYAKQNDNNIVLFTAININSRYVYAYYGKDKSMDTVLEFLKKMEKQSVINSITCDEGTEFNNSDFIDFCKNILPKHNFDLSFRSNIIHYYPQYLFVCNDDFTVSINVTKLENLKYDDLKLKTYPLFQYYNLETLLIVERIYSKDFELFHYHKITKGLIILFILFILLLFYYLLIWQKK
jgi:hypothetical protein